MKSFHSKLSAIAPFVFFPMLIIFRKSKKAAFILVCFCVITLSSCYLNFYRTNTKPNVDANTVSRLRSEDKYFIIHFSDSIRGLEQVHLSNDTLYGNLVTLPEEHSKYLAPSSTEKSRFKKKEQAFVLAEVHLYTNRKLHASGDVLAESVTAFNRADVYEFNQKATRQNHTLSTVGVIASSVAIIGIISIIVAVSATTSAVSAASNGCNCPQVYMENNGSYNFTSGLYSGAVYSTLERTDYLPLTTVPYNAKDISFKIANAKNEEQFINRVELLQVNHAAGVNVLADRHGNIYSYEKTVSPIAASTDGKNDIKDALQQTDEQYYSFDNSANADGFSDVTLTFNKPNNVQNVKLVIHARNTYWGGLVHKEFINLFGDGFDKWRAKQEKADPKDLEKWQTEQALPLMVYLKTNNEWKFIDYYQLIGNTASRDMIMNIDTKDVQGYKIELKLETAYRFWDLDFAGIDYSDNQQFTTTVVEPSEAISSNNTDEKDALANSDKDYVHLVNDESISFKYSIPSTPANTEASYFLVSGGYYHSLTEITGKPDYSELMKFKKPGAFDQFSRTKYKQAQDVAAIFKN